MSRKNRRARNRRRIAANPANPANPAAPAGGNWQVANPRYSIPDYYTADEHLMASRLSYLAREINGMQVVSSATTEVFQTIYLHLCNTLEGYIALATGLFTPHSHGMHYAEGTELGSHVLHHFTHAFHLVSTNVGYIFPGIGVVAGGYALLMQSRLIKQAQQMTLPLRHASHAQRQTIYRYIAMSVVYSFFAEIVQGKLPSHSRVDEFLLQGYSPKQAWFAIIALESAITLKSMEEQTFPAFAHE